MKKDKPELNIVSADEFKDEQEIYHFPFNALDQTVGGSNLGRIEWHVEPIKGKKIRGRYMFEKLLVWATQTRDPRYVKKIFEIPCFSEAITGDSLKRESFLNYVWRVMYCEIHKALHFNSYPANKHTSLQVNVGSSISIEIEFK